MSDAEFMYYLRQIANAQVAVDLSPHEVLNLQMTLIVVNLIENLESKGKNLDRNYLDQIIFEARNRS